MPRELKLCHHHKCHKNFAQGCRWTERFLCTAAWREEVQYFSPDGSQVMGKIPLSEGVGGYHQPLDVSFNSQLVAAGAKDTSAAIFYLPPSSSLQNENGWKHLISIDYDSVRDTQAVAFSCDSKYLAVSGSGGNCAIFHIPSPEEAIRQINNNNNNSNNTNNNNVLVIRQAVRYIKLANSSCLSVALSPNSKFMATHRDGTLVVYNLNVDDKDDDVSLSVSATNESEKATNKSSGNNNVVVVGREFTSEDLNIEIASSCSVEIRFFNDSKRIICCGREGFEIFDIDAGTMILRSPINLKNSYSVAISPCQNLFAISENKTVELYCARTARRVAKSEKIHEQTIYGVCFNHTGTHLASTADSQDVCILELPAFYWEKRAVCFKIRELAANSSKMKESFDIFNVLYLVSKFIDPFFNVDED